ncbi:MAG: LPS-assembly protein LptD [candidate division Zixibacteria bacterium]|nr:LPS-assembly protein LptD [Candidatus Tariuqbacter arcticus]
MGFWNYGFAFTLEYCAAQEDSLLQQTPQALDSVETISFPVEGDSLLIPIQEDTLAERKKSAEIDTIINYFADSIYFGVNSRITILEGHAKVVHKDMTLAAGRITVDWDNNMLTAEPIPDTTWRDSVVFEYDTLQATFFDTVNHVNYDSTVFLISDSTVYTLIDSVTLVGFPRFKQAGDELLGADMIYDLKSKKGFVIQGETEYMDGRYFGEEMKRVGDKVMNVGEGDFTTCDLDTPHYHFHSKRMKLIVKDKVVAKPVVLYFCTVPVAIIPFGIFPSKSGRQSGIILPTYGETASQGRFLRNLGYYFAPSTYWDAQAALDFYERYGVLVKGNARYKLLYRMDGSLSGSFVRMDYSGSKERRWDLKYKHSHILTPTARLNINATFVSDGSYYQDLSSNPQNRMERILRSDAIYRDSYPSINGSMSINLHHEKNLDDETWSATLPRVNFRLGQRSFIPQEEGQDEPYWYNKFYYSAGSNFVNMSSKSRDEETVEYQIGDTTYQETQYFFEHDKQGALKNSYSINTSQAALKYFNLNPSMSINQDITDYRLKYRYNPNTGEVESVKEEGYFARHTFSFSTGLNTKLYGTFPADFWGIIGFRHVLTPSLSFSYKPDFSKKGWAYYQYLTDSSGVEQKYDRYVGQPLLGGTPSAESQTMSISLSNLFQMKRVKMREEEEEIQKLDLFSLNFGTSYNFLAEQFKWGNLSSSFRAEPVRGTRIGPLMGLTIDLQTTHSPYKTTPFGTLVEKFYFEDGNWQRGKLFRLTYFNLSAGLRFASQKKEKSVKKEFVESEEWTAEEDTVETGEGILDLPVMETQDRLGRDLNFKPTDIPWDMNTGLRYTWSRSNTYIEPTRTIWMDNSLNITLTQNWSVSYSNSIDLSTGMLVSSGFTFYRDMHCWEGRLIWNPSGVGQGFFLKINIKSPTLRDLKVEKRRGVGGFLGY